MASGIFQIPKIPELRNRILVMLGLLAVYRIGVFIPVPGTDSTALREFMQQSTGRNTLFGLYDMFSGGALERVSIFTLGIMPYVSASIVVQLLTVAIPALERIQKEGEAGRQRIIQYTRYGTVLIAVVQGLAASFFLENMQFGTGGIVNEPGWGFRLMTILSLTTGTAFIMWLGERISEWGIGNGSSVIIMSGIVVGLPQAGYDTFARMQRQEISFIELLALGVLMFAVVAFVIYCERGQRRIPVQYAKRMVGRRVYAGQSTHLPLKINMAGVIPPIFASSLMVLPATAGSFMRENKVLQDIQAALQNGGVLYLAIFSALTIFFAYFYTSVTFNPADVAENLQKHGGYVPGIRPGKPTAEFLDRVLTRITLAGALYITLVCVLPDVIAQNSQASFRFGGTSLMIVVGVALDLVAQIESHLLTHHYDGLMGEGGTVIRGRRAVR